jgi:hypothetical protein
MSKPTDFRELCAELLRAWDSDSKYCENHAALVELLERARTALSQPESEGVTDEELLESAAKALGYKHIPSDETCLTAEAGELLAFARAIQQRSAHPTIQPVPVRLAWSEVREPCEECRYNHCIAETPFGRILISWKGWKNCPAITPDEVPWSDSWFPVWSDLEKAKAECEAEYSRRIALAFEPTPTP